MEYSFDKRSGDLKSEENLHVVADNYLDVIGFIEKNKLDKNDGILFGNLTGILKYMREILNTKEITYDQILEALKQNKVKENIVSFWLEEKIITKASDIYSSISDGYPELIKQFEKKYETIEKIEIERSMAEELKNGNFKNTNKLTSLNNELIELLVKYDGPIELDGLKSITPEEAEKLSLHKGSILLNGLKSISDKIAEFLSKHEEGYIFLNGLTDLSDEAAYFLSRNSGGSKGGIELLGLKSISNKAIKEYIMKPEGTGELVYSPYVVAKIKELREF
jgi:hypothetical protein